ncbi:unnamed protein product [Effrenium voratum]|uniref:Uncharacterized protein n=1 Tax=Effrenium voratum TaxID=2562239 RepID=A0AA36J4T9_9DINO|nr:unnamed protein product [Effrenium voratum]CAJ1420807.1 unnamed protein product [Effrenium voratum]
MTPTTINSKRCFPSKASPGRFSKYFPENNHLDELDGVLCKELSLAPKDVKVAVLDGLHISVASIHLLCTQETSSLFAFEFELAGVSLEPVPCIEESSRKSKFRLRGCSWSTLKRRISLQQLRLAAARLTSRNQPPALLCLSDCSLELLEGRDVGRRKDRRNGSARVALIPREIRGSLTLPRIEVHFGHPEIMGLLGLAKEALQPVCPPEELLPAAARERLQAIRRPRDGTAARTRRTRRTAHAAAAAAAAAVRAAGAAGTAMGTAVAAVAARDARRSGQAAERALSFFRKKAVGSTATSQLEALQLREEQELREALALSMQEFEHSQVDQDVECLPEEHDLDIPEGSVSAEDHDQDGSLLGTSSEDDALEEFQEGDSMVNKSSLSSPPMGLRFLCMNVSIGKLNLNLSIKDRADGFCLEASGLSMSSETFVHLLTAEVPCLQRLGILPDGHQASAVSHSTSCCVTICSAELHLLGRDGKDGKDGKERPQLLLGKRTLKAPWMLTARLAAESQTLGVGSDTRLEADALHELTLEGCLHGVKVCPELCLDVLQPTLEMLRELLATAREVQPASHNGAQHHFHPVISLSFRDTVIDLSSVSPHPLKPLRVIIPSLNINVAEMGSFKPPPVPQWHSSPTDIDSASDAHHYTCLCSTEDLKRSHTWEVLVTERQWQTTCSRGDREYEIKAHGEHPDHSEHVLVPSEHLGEHLLVPALEILMLSSSKLKALEQLQAWEDMAERQHAASSINVQKDLARRIPVVLEMMMAKGEESIEREKRSQESKESEGGQGGQNGLRAQLEALRGELRSLDAERRESELQLKDAEREAALALALLRAEKLQKEQRLQQQLQEEQEITQALARLVEQQHAAISAISAISVAST